MSSPSVYLDTSFISALWYEGNDVSVLARRFHSREWWDREHAHYRIARITRVNSTGSFP